MSDFDYVITSTPLTASTTLTSMLRTTMSFFPRLLGAAVYPPEGSLGKIQHTIGSSRFLQMAFHLTF